MIFQGEKVQVFRSSEIPIGHVGIPRKLMSRLLISPKQLLDGESLGHKKVFAIDVNPERVQFIKNKFSVSDYFILVNKKLVTLGGVDLDHPLPQVAPPRPSFHLLESKDVPEGSLTMAPDVLNKLQFCWNDTISIGNCDFKIKPATRGDIDTTKDSTLLYVFINPVDVKPDWTVYKKPELAERKLNDQQKAAIYLKNNIGDLSDNIDTEVMKLGNKHVVRLHHKTCSIGVGKSKEVDLALMGALDKLREELVEVRSQIDQTLNRLHNPD